MNDTLIESFFSMQDEQTDVERSTGQIQGSTCRADLYKYHDKVKADLVVFHGVIQAW